MPVAVGTIVLVGFSVGVGEGVDVTVGMACWVGAVQDVITTIVEIIKLIFFGYKYFMGLDPL